MPCCAVGALRKASCSKGRTGLSSSARSSLDWSDFEHLIAEAFRREGFVTNLTDPGPDGGVDLVLTSVRERIVNEWTQLMQGYEVRDHTDVYQRALTWEEGRRDTTQVRRIVDERLERNQLTRCVWSRSDLRRSQYHIDHCFPWSRWNNNDLWNLLPATARANAAKAEKLPAAPLLEGAKPEILDWWRAAFVGQEREQQFYMEAEGALPLVRHDRTLESVFEGMLQQRLRLKMNQQLVEWMGMGSP